MAKAKGKDHLLDYIHPLEKDPLVELRAALGYLFGTSYRGIEVASVLKAKRLTKYVIFLAECNVFRKYSKDFIMSNLPRLHRKLEFALYACIDKEYKKIGLSHLRQVMPSIDSFGNVYMVSSGFDMFVPLSEYHDMRQYAYEMAESVVMQIMAIFQVIIQQEFADEDDESQDQGGYEDEDDDS